MSKSSMQLRLIILAAYHAALTIGCTGLTLPDDEDDPCTAPNATRIAPTAGASAASSCLGIQGYFWTATDGHSTLTATFSDATVCVRGQIEQVVGKDYTNYWGATVGVNFNQRPGGTPGSYNATAHGVSGFEAVVSGSSVPASARMRLQLIDAQDRLFCRKGLDVATSDALLGDFRENCWSTTPGAPPPAASLKSLAVAIVAQDTVPFSVDMCVELAGQLADAEG